MEENVPGTTCEEYAGAGDVAGPPVSSHWVPVLDCVAEVLHRESHHFGVEGAAGLEKGGQR